MRVRTGAWILLLPLAAATTGWADSNAGPPRMPGAVEAVAAGLDVEKQLLQEDLVAFRTASARRTEAVALAGEAFEALDVLVRAGSFDPAALDQARNKLIEAERLRNDAVREEGALLDRVIERKRKIVLLESRLSDLQNRTGEAVGPLTATWEVTLMPSGQRGRMVLTQNGTLVSGTYALDGGWSGSLRGTLVNRKVFLERIDARVGRWGTFEGTLSSDGKTIRGTWSRLELAGLDGAEGQWIAGRSEDDAP